MTVLRSRRGGFFAVFLTLLVAGCGSIRETVTSVSESVVPTCPDAGILTEASRLTRFQEHSKGDLTDVLYESEIRKVESSCSWSEEVIVVDLELEFVVAHGPASQGEKPRIDYFVGVTDRYRNVLSKENLETTPTIPPGASATAWKEQLKQRIPLEPGKNGGDYSVFVGFQLNHAELDYNRRWYGRR
ncbi:MAG: hypothetical protein J4G10_02300 [Alphaproteobacteria bacterium]|nr:hypothetical protein [Alphaproteobacteria bacterium]